ncbi:c-type cytochrome [Marinimicrococcus flavescens]|uniref:Cytochrome c n=1 Tax=Marinimicrococcus flavescens TaxID=3031815 RepID=A0AAP4D6G4_9PROT|nr:cytochrome c [Marinimicrococcus flavescens]
MRRAALAAGSVAAAALGATLLWSIHGEDGASGAAPATLAQGGQVYAESCASCHGARLEGRPDWQTPLPSGRLPAPPHDASGHTWHHGDGLLLRIIRDGTAAVVGGGYESDMPGFGGVLSEEEIRAVLAFIKSGWPERERAYQAEMTRREGEAR